ncbi:sigma-70 family RNA polymerase sigma factor [Streptomyces sp. NBC_01476]|uniref:sigma-70 family RNA polymerase sigma factor n=1 Tax=Streptomyces sp. NBC_01476 TaxID=2903881 RepID=UPI002E34F0AE|nr:sigma-70 family RNA polymerase sigma factor [Streptomyces sp. NBC_01476]
MTATAIDTPAPIPSMPSRSPRTEQRMRELYEVNAAPVFRTLLRWTRGDRQAAEDLVQETMLRAWKNLDVLHDDGPEAARPWLLTVSRRLAIDSHRATSARPTEVEDDALEDMALTADPFEKVLDRQVLRDALACLSAMHREVLTHVYILHQSVRQAAEALGIPEGTVKSRTHKAVRALRDALGDFHSDGVPTTGGGPGRDRSGAVHVTPA